MKKKVFLGLLVTVFMCLFVSTSAFAITQSEAVAWLKTQAANNTKFDVDGKNPYQCSDFVSAYINYIIYGDPYYWKNNNHQGFTTHEAYQYFDLKTYPSTWQQFHILQVLFLSQGILYA